MASTSGPTNTIRDTMRDAKDAVNETRRAASAASGDIQADVDALRQDISRLANQVGDILSSKGNVAWDRAKANVGISAERCARCSASAIASAGFASVAAIMSFATLRRRYDCRRFPLI